MVGAATRQILASQPVGVTIAGTIDSYHAAVSDAIALACQAQTGAEAVSAMLDASERIVGVFELVDLARANDQPLSQIAAASACLDASLDLAWMGRAIDRLPAGNRWQARARSQLASELRRLRQKLLQRNFVDPQSVVAEACDVIGELKRDAPQDLAMLSAGLAEIARLLVA